MNAQGRRRGFRITVGTLAVLCAALLALTSLSGCKRIYVMTIAPPNPFLGEWHAEYTWDGVAYSTEYEFESNGRYSYRSQSSSGAIREQEMTEGTYDYDSDTLVLTPDSSVVDSRFRYEFTSDDELELEERISATRLRVVVYHLHS